MTLGDVVHVSVERFETTPLITPDSDPEIGIEVNPERIEEHRIL